MSTLSLYGREDSLETGKRKLHSETIDHISVAADRIGSPDDKVSVVVESSRHGQVALYLETLTALEVAEMLLRAASHNGMTAATADLLADALESLDVAVKNYRLDLKTRRPPT